MSEPSRETKYMDVAEFRRLGYLMEANRNFFHPHGLALEMRKVTTSWWSASQDGEWSRARVYDVTEALVAAGVALDEHALDRVARVVCAAIWPDGSTMLSGVWDYREDPEGVVYGNLDDADAERARVIADERRRHERHRAELFTPRRAALSSLFNPRDPSEDERPDVEPFGWREAPE